MRFGENGCAVERDVEDCNAVTRFQQGLGHVKADAFVCP